MFVEILYHALILDLGWFVQLLLGNLFWVFGLIAIGYYFFGGSIKNVLTATVLLSLSIFVWIDFGTAIGIPLFVGSFLLINYMVKLSSLSVAANHPELKHKLVYVNEIMAILAVIFYFIFFAPV